MALNNSEIYKKTIGFSVRRLLWDALGWLALIVMSVAGFVIAQNVSNAGLVGLGIGFIVGAIMMYVILHYFAYSYKAGQIAMMTEGVTKGKLPQDVIGTGKKVVKERFSTVVAYYAVTGVIKNVFQQVGNGITAVGKAIGGDTGNAVGSTISSVIQTVVRYLCDCCLGWVFYRKDESAGRATMEGAVIFFKHGKTLAKNLGRVFGIGTISYVTIGGILTVIFYLIFMNFPDAFVRMQEALANNNKVPTWMLDPTVLTWISSAVCGAILWSMIHSNFVRPFILVGVLRNYIESGTEDKISDSDFEVLDKKSDKFRKLHEEVKAGKK